MLLKLNNSQAHYFTIGVVSSIVLALFCVFGLGYAVENKSVIALMVSLPVTLLFGAVLWSSGISYRNLSPKIEDCKMIKDNIYQLRKETLMRMWAQKLIEINSEKS